MDANPGAAMCRCGHLAGDHYDYICNDLVTTRCRSCDPFTGTRHESTNIGMDHDSYVAAMYRAADHPFEPAESWTVPVKILHLETGQEWDVEEVRSHDPGWLAYLPVPGIALQGHYRATYPDGTVVELEWP